jgi:hypothetical protein
LSHHLGVPDGLTRLATIGPTLTPAPQPPQPMRRKMADTALGPQLMNISPTTPEAFGIFGGALNLNYSKSVQRHWARDIPALIKAADANWPAILD